MFNMKIPFFVQEFTDEMEAAAVGVYNTIEFYAAEFDVGTRFTLERSQDGGVSWETVLGSNVSYTVPQYYTVFDYSPTYSQYLYSDGIHLTLAPAWASV